MKHSNHDYGDKMPNDRSSSKGFKAGAGGHNTGASTGLKKSNEMRADVTKQPSNKDPYPYGMS